MIQDDVLYGAAEAAIGYRKSVADRGSTVAPYLDVLASFDAPLPEGPTDCTEVIGDLVENASPGLRSMTSPEFFGWVIGGSHPVGVAADWLTSA